MAPNSKDIPVASPDRKKGYVVDTHLKLPSDIGTDYNFKRKWVWPNLIGFILLHILGFYGIYMMFYSHFHTTFWMLVLVLASGEGVTIGAHRMYAHKAFKARFILRLGLVLLQTVAGQNCMYIWVRDHRLHHKYSDSDADPHNANRGFFFSHMGWLMSRKHPAVITKGKTIDMSDLEADFIVMFQKFFYKPLYLLFALALPVTIPVWLWEEEYWNSLLICYFSRYVVLLHITWLVNSAAHFYGTKPYDKSMLAVESFFVSFLTVGEGWHNYHHAFPWDYRAAEYGTSFSFTTFLIDVLAWMGLAYDLKTTPDDMVQRRAMRSGDGSHKYCVEQPGKTDVNGNLPIEKDKHLFSNHKEEVHVNGDVKANLTNGSLADKVFANGKIHVESDKDK
ncbi:hypothetical protein Trydic_g6273 [Trypoxylus dichotomus]